MIRAFLAVLLLCTAAPAVASETNASSRRLAEAAEEYSRHVMARDIGARRAQGLPIERLPEVSPADAASEAAFGRALLENLRGVRPDELDRDETVSLHILRWKAEGAVAEPSLYWLRFPVTPYSSPFGQVNLVFTTHRFQGQGDLDRYRSLLTAYPALLEQVRKKLVEQRARGILLPKDEIDLVLPFLASFAGRGEASLFHVGKGRLAAVTPAEADAFQRQVDEVVDGKVAPALDALIGLLKGDYRTSAPDAVGLAQYPGGPEAYRHLVRWHTTLDLLPEEVHRVGLEEVERLEARMKSVRDTLGWKGSRAEFHGHLQTDPRFFATTPDEVGERLRRHARRIEPKIDAFFLSRPRAPYDVKRLHPTLESTVTYGYYQVPTTADPKGYYNYNGSNLRERSLINAAALTYHELVPGHHFQMALQRENTALPAFRKTNMDTAYIEGWGTYAADLAEEMGMYADPYDLYGRLMMEMFLAVRLVVDTGMNALGWPRARAVEYMKDHVQESDTQIHTETLRYSVDLPAQALAYRMGARRLVELRERARRALGPRFDIRKFHQAVLGSGSMPMAVLERHIDGFIETER